jgi:tRNA(Ile)-lysidine synthase TilS/MesJ
LSYAPIEYKGEPKLEELLDTYRTRNIVAVSGGRDSTFMLYELIDAYDMRVLAYNYDNGFVSEQAKLNLKEITDATGVDLVTNLRLSPMYIRE